VDPLSKLESDVVNALDKRRGELVDLAVALIGFDTTARGLDDPPREERALQEYLAERLRHAGAEIDLWEPDRGELAGSRQVPDTIDFTGRPQLVARFPGRGDGRSLLFNGHIDAVSVEPRTCWSSDPLRAEERDGMLYGRGTCDMKGGVAAMVFAAETLAELGVTLSGDLLVNTVTDEEWNGAGGLAAVAHGVRADAGLVPEPTGFEAWVACRGILHSTIIVAGRTGHAEVPQPDWRAGGAVNAIEKAEVLLAGLGEVRDRWGATFAHPLLTPGGPVATMINAGHWWVMLPGECQITIDVTYLPLQVDTDGYGSSVVNEIEQHLLAAAREDDWLAEHLPVFHWHLDMPPAEVAVDHEIVGCALGAAEALGLRSAIGALHSWHDAATFTRCGTPAISFGPSGLQTAHGVDECVPVDDLVACAKAYALSALRFTTTP
jgi:acetylornithine deacetylase